MSQASQALYGFSLYDIEPVQPTHRSAQFVALSRALRRPWAEPEGRTKRRFDWGKVTSYSEETAKVAQLVEHSSEKAGVAGSSPALGTTSFLRPIPVTLLGPLSCEQQALTTGCQVIPEGTDHLLLLLL